MTSSMFSSLLLCDIKFPFTHIKVLFISISFLSLLFPFLLSISLCNSDNVPFSCYWCVCVCVCLSVHIRLLRARICVGASVNVHQAAGALNDPAFSLPHYICTLMKSAMRSPPSPACPGVTAPQRTPLSS